MSRVAEKISFKDQLIAHFGGRLSLLHSDHTLRKAALAHFAETGFPTRRSEDYKYIAPDQLFKKELGFNTEQVRIITSADIEKLSAGINAHVIVVVNGQFVPELSALAAIPAGIEVHSLADACVSNATARAHYGKYASPADDPFIALSTAGAEDGVFIHIHEKAVEDLPIHILHLTNNATEAFFQPRNLIVCGKGTQATIIETFNTIGPVRSFNNALTEIAVADGSALDHYRFQWEGDAGQLLSTVQAHVSEKGNYSNWTFTLGGAWVRNNLNVVLGGRNAESHLFGLYLPNGSQVCDNHTVVDHTVPDCHSNELYKGVISGKATAVFNGKIFVRPNAQKTNAFQTNRNILMSDDASVYTKPQLEIYADDVKCSHGTSTGRIDEEALFYLRARGIGEENARKLLIRAFAEEVVEKIKTESLREFIDSRIDDLLP